MKEWRGNKVTLFVGRKKYSPGQSCMLQFILKKRNTRNYVHSTINKCNKKTSMKHTISIVSMTIVSLTFRFSFVTVSRDSRLHWEIVIIK